MSLRKPPSSLPKWPRLQPPSRHPLSPPHTNTHHVLNDRRTATSSRPFHSTPPKCAKWATPSLSKRRRTKVPLFTNDYLMTESAAGDPRPYLHNIEAYGEKYLEVSKSYDFPNIPPYLSAKTFKSVARELAAVASKNPPSAHAIRSVSKDVDVVWGISNVIQAFSRNDLLSMEVGQWARTAAIAAGVRKPILDTAATFIRSTSVTTRTPLIDQVEQLAQMEVASAMLLQAKLLGRSGKFTEAIAMMDKLWPRIYPTRLMPIPEHDITSSKNIEPPWQIYTWLKGSVGDKKAVDETLKKAALEYQDPEALLNYARLVMIEGDLEMYEQCMCQSAMSGNPEACRKLANFYYLTFHGRFPRRGENKTKQTKDENNNDEVAEPTKTATATATAVINYIKQLASHLHTLLPENLSQKLTSISSYLSEEVSYIFGVSRRREEYEKLAFDWYHLAATHGSPKAALIYAILLRENRQMDETYTYLEKCVSNAQLKPLAVRLLERWEEEGYEPSIPVKLLDT